MLALGLLVTARLPGQEPRATGRKEVVLATTTSVRDAGLLEMLLPAFERASGLRVKVLAVGSGLALEIGRRGEADLLIVHDPAREQEFVEAGFGIDRAALMYNEFVVLGPVADPAGTGDAPSAAAAFRAIADREARFVSRGDRSGTHAKEMALWAAAGLDPEGRKWYRESGQGMGQTLQIANELQSYALSDRGTYLAHKSPLDLVVLVDGDTVLRNPYHIILANPGRFPWVSVAGARRLREYLLNAETQRRIGEFGRSRHGQPLFFPAQPDLSGGAPRLQGSSGRYPSNPQGRAGRSELGRPAGR